MFKYLNPVKFASQLFNGANVKMPRGFSLVEFLIVILIIAIFSTITFPNYRSAQQQLTLQRSASKLAQDIRRAQEMAVSAKECPSSICGVSTMPPGYGIYLKQGDSYYYIYADTNPAAGQERYDGGDAIVEIINLENGVKISNASPSSLSSLSINFKPPDPEVNIAGGGEEAVITLSAGSFTKTVKVNKAGLIYVE